MTMEHAYNVTKQDPMGSSRADPPPQILCFSSSLKYKMHLVGGLQDIET